MAVGLYLMDREEGVNIYKMDAKKRINSFSKIDKILKVSQTRSPLLIRACILQQAWLQCGFCFYTRLVYNRFGYNVASVSVHHWFTTGLVTMWFLFLTGLQQAWLQCSFCFYTPLVYNRLGYNAVCVSIHHWFTTGLVTMWFLFLYTTGLQQAWLQCGFCF